MRPLMPALLLTSLLQRCTGLEPSRTLMHYAAFATAPRLALPPPRRQPPGCARRRITTASAHAHTTETTPEEGASVSLAEHVWRPKAEAHKRRVLELLEEGFAPADHVPRRYEEQTKKDGFRKLNEKHAVFNFLHEYYNVRGAKGTRRMGRWSSGLPYVTLEGATAADVEAGTLNRLGCEVHAGGVTYDARRHFARAEPAAATPFLWYHSLLSATTSNKPILHCYNLHEWAMQYWPDGAPPPPRSGTRRARCRCA